MKKKILMLALTVALLAIVVGGSLAYFIAEDEVTNTFTMGSVKIEIYENGKATDSDTISFGALKPIVNVDNPGEDANYMKKVVEVKNIGVNDAYIRTHIAIPTALVNYLCLEVNTANWSKQANTAAIVDGVAYTVYTFDYESAVSGASFTTELLKGVYLSSDVDMVEDSQGNLLFVKRTDGEITYESGFVAHTKTADGYVSNVINVLVASCAIQTRGFENGPTDALNTGFGQGTNPWQNK